MKKSYYLLLVMLICLLGVLPLAAQSKKKNKRHPKQQTGNTSFNSRIRGEPSGPREYLYLYQTSTRGTLSGNKCIEDYTEKIGLRYVILPANQEAGMSSIEIRLNNFGVKFLLLLKKGPFWHHRLSRQIRKCREKSGDFVGFNFIIKD